MSIIKMASCVNVNRMFVANLLLTTIFALFVGGGYTRTLAGNGDQCESICASTYSNDEISNQMICRQGCRLMTLSDFMTSSDGSENMKDAQAVCLQSCKDAYIGNDMQSACAFGCQAQIPNMENQHKHLESYYKNQMQMSSALSGLHDYYSRMMDCIVDRFNHEVSFGWRVRSGGNVGQMTVIVSSDVNMEPILDSIFDSSEQKTSSYLETNLASVDRAATPNLKAVQQAESAVVINQPEGHEGQLVIATKSHVDWTLCIERTGTSKKLILMITVVLLTAIVLCVCSGNSAPAGAQPYWHSDEKLSINGDLDYLKVINKDDLLISTKPQEPQWNAPPLPMKIPIESV